MVSSVAVNRDQTRFRVNVRLEFCFYHKDSQDGSDLWLTQEMIDMARQGQADWDALSNLSVVHLFWSWSLSLLGLLLTSRSLPHTSEIGTAQGPHLSSSSMFVFLPVAFALGALVTISVLRLQRSWTPSGLL